MEELIIPAAPHWYKANIIACAPDNTLLCGAKNDLTIIKEDGKVTILSGPLSYTTSIGINKKWNDPNKYCVVLYECGILKIWDINSLSEKYSIDLHVETCDLIGAVFAGEDRVVTVSTSGVVTIWNFITNELNVMKHLFPPKSIITCLSACPYSPWLVAFGLHKGLIFVCDLRRKGSVRFKLRGHEKSVISLVWCPVPINIFPKNPNNTVKRYPVETNSEIEQKTDKINKENAWRNLKYVDDVIKNKDKTDESSLSTDKQQECNFCDFLKECQLLKTKILEIDSDNKSDTIVDYSVEDGKENSKQTANIIETDNETIYKYIEERNYDVLEEKSDRPLPNLYDPSGDFFDEINYTNDRETGEVIGGKNVNINEVLKTKILEIEDTAEVLDKDPVEIEVTDEVSKKNTVEIEDTTEVLDENPVEMEDTDEVSKKNTVEIEDTTEVLDENPVEMEDTDEVSKKSIAEIEDTATVSDKNPVNIKEPVEISEKNTVDTDTAEVLDESPVEIEDTVEVSEKITVEIEETAKILDKNPIEIEDTVEVSEKNTIEDTSEVLDENPVEIEVSDKNTVKIEDTVDVLDKYPLEVEDNAKVLDKSPVEIEFTFEVLKKNIVEIEEEPRDEYLLASTGYDKNIYIWRVGTDGRMQTFFSLPKKKYKTKNNWVAACWPTPTNLITTSLNDEILIWDLTKLKQHSVVHKEHHGIVFNIVAPIKYLTKENWSEKIDLQIWSQNGFEIINYNITDNETKLFYSTITSFVSVLQLSPLDPNRLAIGLRDGYIRIWDLSSYNLKSIKLKTVKRIQNKVSTLCWHPTKENILAYGGEDGQIGFVDILTQKSVIFRHSLHNSVHHIEYGPYFNTKDVLYLYAVGENRIFIYNVDKPINTPEQLELSEKLLAHRFSWKPDFSLLLVSLKDGSLHVFNQQLELLTKLYFNEKGFNSIVWHPNPSRSNWFAAATTKGFLIYDCSELLKNPNEKNLIENKIVDVDGHLKPVTNLCWNPFKNNQLLSSSTDGLTHVWDIEKKIIIATFVDPYCKQLSTPTTWSPLDENFVLLGNRLITVWNINNYPPKCDEEFMTTRKKLLKIESGTYKPEVEVGNNKPKKIPKNCIVPTLYTSNDENLGHQVSNMRKLLERSLNQQTNNDIFELFGSRDDVMNLLSRNYELHNKESKLLYCDLISLWKGDISDRIKSAIEENRVTPSTIMLAPMVSPKLWQDACESYANKLSESQDSDPLEIVKFYLACHKIEEAIHVLCQAHLYREALALAKCRFTENSETVRKVTEEWANHAVVNGNFEAAAYCYLSLGNFEEAAQVLARRNNVEFLEFAKELAIKCNNQDLCDSIKFKCDEIAKNHRQDKKLLPTRIEIELKTVPHYNHQDEHSSLEFCDAEDLQE